MRNATHSIGVALIIVGLFLSGCATPPATVTPEPLPRLIADASVASDFNALAQETWQQFLEVFRARADCFGDVRLHATTVLDSRAKYDPDTATVTVRVPGTPAMLQSALIHEWAHHVEFQCPAQKELRPAFLAAQGLPADTLWRPDETPANTPESEWATIPSEQYAEATIEVVLGRRQIPTTARVTTEAVRVIAQWAAGQ
jgi:hypothetical protein